MLKDWLPEALKAGLTEREFLKMTPAAIKRHMDAYSERLRDSYDQLELHAWRTGMYCLAAIGTAFSKRRVRYPDNPLKPQIDDTIEYTEEEKEYYRQKFLQSLLDRQKRFELAKKAKQGG